MKAVAAASILALSLALTPAASPAKSVSSPYMAALTDPARPADDRARDAARHPIELLELAGIKPGQKVADFIMGGGYFTRILAKAVGPKGRVYAYQPAEFISFRAQYGADQDNVARAYANIVPSRESLGAVQFPVPLDAIITIQNYHDMHLKASPTGLADQVNAALFKALKPGGVLLVVDHSALDGSDLSVPQTLHRIDAATARAEIEKAGFKFAGSSNVLRNPGDPRTASVFDPAIRGKTDQFVMKFVKPRRR